MTQGKLDTQGEVVAASYPWPFKAEIAAEDAASRVASILRIRVDITCLSNQTVLRGNHHLTPSHLPYLGKHCGQNTNIEYVAKSREKPYNV